MSTKAWGGADSRKARAHCLPLVLQGVPCWRCRKPIVGQLVNGKWEGQVWHAGHIEGREDGGSNDPSNLMPEHETCSTSAGGKSGVKHMQAANNARRRARGSTKSPRQAQSGLFESDGVAQASCPLPFSIPVGFSSETRAQATILSPWPEDTDLAEAHLGAQWLGLPLFEQGIEVASVMQAMREDGRPEYRTVAVEMARRSAKTTAINATLLGRCLTRPGYRVASTAQTGVIARARLMDVQTALRAGEFEESGLGQCLQGMGDTRIRFSNGSVWQALPPKPGAFRSEAYDVVLVDEAGELPPDEAEELLGGLLPTMDTRPTAQLIVAGTPGTSRAGLLWTRLEHLRQGRARVGGVVYEAGDREVFVDYSTPDAPVVDWDLLLRVHPGLSCGLTDMETIVGNIEDMGLEKWCREYLCQWPRNASVTALDLTAWEACETTGEPQRPENAGIAWDIDKDGEMATIVAAWRDASGKAHFEVIAADTGSDWLPKEARDLQQEYRLAFAHNEIGYNIEVSQRMTKPPYRVRSTPVDFKGQVGAVARIEKEIHKRNVVQYGDPELTTAIGASVWRPAGNARLLLSRTGVCAVVAAANALWTYDLRATTGTGRRSRAVTGSSELEVRRASRQRRSA